MKKMILALCLALAAAPVVAEGRSFKDWLKDLDARIRRTEDKRRDQLITAGAVRGNKESDAGKLYWKGRKEVRPVTAEELDAFKASVALAGAGKSAEAKKGLEDFLVKFPGSPLEEDAKETLTYLNQVPASAETAKDAEAAPAPKN